MAPNNILLNKEISVNKNRLHMQNEIMFVSDTITDENLLHDIGELPTDDIEGAEFCIDEIKPVFKKKRK